uniref:Pancreatic trypsin inhibitor n=1 Tax=Rhipicephalus zambeziensis TaxID=60191 RepID=A0A224Y7W0_9ACAR
MKECQHTCISIAGVHKPPQVDRGIGVLTAPSSTPSQEHTIQNQLNRPMVPHSLPQKPTQQPAAQQQTNPPNVPPVQPTVNGPQPSVPTTSPVQEQATEKQSSLPNTVAPISQKQPPATVLPSIQEPNTQQQTKTNIRWSSTEQSSKEQVNATTPKQPFPSTPQKQKFSISPTVSQSQQQSLQRLMGSSNLPPIPKLVTQQTSSKETRIDQNIKEIPQPSRGVSQAQPQLTEQRHSTALATPPNEQLVTQQQSASLVDPNQYWTVSQGVENQVFPMYPRPLPFGFR